MATILYGVSPIGFGHASRSVAIGLKLRERSLEPEFATGGPAVKFLESYGFKVHDVVSEPDPRGVGRRDEDGHAVVSQVLVRLQVDQQEDGRARHEALSQARSSGTRSSPPSPSPSRTGIAHAMISDELQLGFARGAIAKRVEARVSEWYADLQRRVSNLLVPSFGTDSGNIHYMTPVTREVTKSREAARAEHGLPLDSSVVLFSSSGSGIGRFLLRQVAGGVQEGVHALGGLRDDRGRRPARGSRERARARDSPRQPEPDRRGRPGDLDRWEEHHRRVRRAAAPR